MAWGHSRGEGTRTPPPSGLEASLAAKLPFTSDQGKKLGRRWSEKKKMRKKGSLATEWSADLAKGTQKGWTPDADERPAGREGTFGTVEGCQKERSTSPDYTTL